MPSLLELARYVESQSYIWTVRELLDIQIGLFLLKVLKYVT